MNSLHAKFVELLNGGSGRLLDAGAGTGELSDALSKIGFEVTPCDISPRDFKYGNCKKVDLNQDLPYGKAEFDHMVCSEVVEHIENPHHLLREANRVLKRGGTLVISTPNIANVFSRVKFLFIGKFFCFSDEERRGGHLNPVSWWEMGEALEKHGFRLEKRAAGTNLLLSGCAGSRMAAKRALARFSLLILYPFIKPKDAVLLKADSVVFMAKKVKECQTRFDTIDKQRLVKEC